ncbi:MAG: OsmC family protein [Anaerolineae bacterium]|nr:OsmC family protein [Anaerolineae bacterium]
MGITNISARWTGEALHFMGVDSQGKEVRMGGKEGFPPTQMMLIGLAGCMGMDVLSILQKKRQDVTGVDVNVIAYNPDEYPKPYHTAEIEIKVQGSKVDPKAVARAIELSIDKYCVVGQTLQNKIELKTSFSIVE